MNLALLTAPPDNNWGDRVLNAASAFKGEHVNPRIFMTAEDLKRFDGIVVGPGGLITIDTVPGSVSGWQWNIPTVEMEKLDMPIVGYALGWNLFYNQFTALMLKIPSGQIESVVDSLRMFSRKSRYLTFRHLSDVRAFMASIDNRARLCYCPSIKMAAKYRRPRKNGKVAINVAFDRPIMRPDLGGIISFTRAFPDAPLIVHMREDLEPASRFGREIIDLSTMTPEEGFAVYTEFEYIVAMRGHAQMLAAALGCKVTGLDTHPKIAAFGMDSGTQVIKPYEEPELIYNAPRWNPEEAIHNINQREQELGEVLGV